MTTATHFYVLAGLVGMVQGGTQALSRSLFASMIPQHKIGEFFGFFSVFEKFAGIFGPLLFAGTIAATGSSRNAILSVIGFFAVGAAILALVDLDAGRRQALAADAAVAARGLSGRPGAACTSNDTCACPSAPRHDAGFGPRPGSSPPARSAGRCGSLRSGRRGRTLPPGATRRAVPPSTVTLKPSVSGIGAVGADGHLDPAVGGDADEGLVAAGGERQDRERNERLEACRHGNLLMPKHLAAPWRFP